MSALFRALVLGHLRSNRLRALVTLIAVGLGVAISLAIDLANATAVASFATSVNVVASHVNLQMLGVGRGFDERALLRVRPSMGVSFARWIDHRWARLLRQVLPLVQRDPSPLRHFACRPQPPCTSAEKTLPSKRVTPSC
ncbi:MAG: hypothetical protein IAI50_07365 [Candidatus Eremiobacteraeota bacterium]|nr:hypothetical protein [Candidatus Eremiobacteraeota bacterium]